MAGRGLELKNTPLPIQPIEISKEEVAFWKAEIRASLKRQKDEFITRIGYEKCIKYFEALQTAEGADISQMAIIDEFSPAIISILNTVYNQNPSVAVTALRPESDGMVHPSLIYLLQNPDFKPFKLSDLMNGAMKYGMDKVGMKEEMQLAAFDLMVAGFAVTEMNFMAEQKGVQQDSRVDATTPQSETLIDNSLVDKAGQMIAGLIDKVKKAFTKEEVEEDVASKVQNERIDFTDSTYCKRWNPLDVLFDSKAVVFKDSRFITKIIYMSLADFNVRFPDFKGRISSSSGFVTDTTYQTHNDPDHRKGIKVFQTEIKKKGVRNCILVTVDGIDEALEYYEDPIITNGFKLKYRCLDKYGKIYPMSRAKKAMKTQDDINHYMTIQFEHVDRAMRKIAVYMQGLTAAGQSAQRSSDVYAIVEKQTPQAVYEAMPAPSVVPENKEIIALCKDSINKTLQTSELAKSGKSDNEFATQDVLESQSFQVSTNAVSDTLQDLADELLDALKDIIMQVWDGEDYFKVTGIKGGDQWYTPEMGPLADILVGDFMIKSNMITAQKPNPMKDRQESIEYAGWITSPQTMAFAQMHGKRPSMMALDNVVKNFNQNPETAFEDIEMTPPMGPPQITQVPNRNGEPGGQAPQENTQEMPPNRMPINAPISA